MECPQCSVDVVTPVCLQCGAEVYPADSAHFPAVTWGEVQRHLIERLFIDEEWRVESEDCIEWWPWFLRQRIFVGSSGQWEDDPEDNYVRVVAETFIAFAPEELGLELALEANWECPIGAIVWENGAIKHRVALALNPQCRELLTLFHTQVLIQATLAHEFALAWAEELNLEIAMSAHPASGSRSEPDDLLSVYHGDWDPSQDIVNMNLRIHTARPLMRRVMNSRGWLDGYSAEDVDFYNGSRFDLAIGEMPDSHVSEKFGSGLFVLVRVLEPGRVFTPHDANVANLILSEQEFTSFFGPVLAGPAAENFGSHMRMYLPYAYLAEKSHPVDGLSIAITNAALHCAAAVKVFLEGLDSMSEPTDLL